MLASFRSWTFCIVASALTVSVLSVYIWNRKRKSYVRVGKIKKLFFYPVKSLKAVEVTKGKCTKFGFEVDGVLDRSFMVVTDKGVLVSQREAPTLVLLSPHVTEKYLSISGPNIKDLKIKLKKELSPEDKVIDCRIHGDTIGGVDCGEEAASWFQSYLNMEGVRLVQFFPFTTVRKYTRSNPFFIKMRKETPAAFQDDAAIHILSQASIDDVNSNVTEKEITAYTFRPTILAEECEAYAEDSWKYMKFENGVEMLRVFLTGRCLLTTNTPDKGILDKKEPLVTLRKYRIPADPEILKIHGSVPVLGTTCAILSPGEIQVGDDIFAVLDEKPKMQLKEA